MNIKNIQKDSIYFPLYQKYGEDYVVKAGYFENEAADNCMSDKELEKTLHLLTTALPSLKDLEGNPCILLNTGCYNPLHGDHIRMMEQAEFELLSKGYDVVMSYFAPDADEYVKSKSDRGYLNIHQRISDIEKCLKDKKRMSVDPWAGLYAKKDVNFTTIYRRLELYIEKYIGRKLPIFYVCGSDRGNFSYTFEDKTIVVERNGVKSNVHSNSIYIPTYNNNRLTKSSTEIREVWKLNPLEKRDLILRVDNSTDPYTGSIAEKLLKLFDEHFKSIKLNYQWEQENRFLEIPQEIVSLDSLLKGY